MKTHLITRKRGFGPWRQQQSPRAASETISRGRPGICEPGFCGRTQSSAHIYHHFLLLGRNDDLMPTQMVRWSTELLQVANQWLKNAENLRSWASRPPHGGFRCNNWWRSRWIQRVYANYRPIPPHFDLDRPWRSCSLTAYFRLLLTWNARSKLLWELWYQIIIDPVLHGPQDYDRSDISNCRGKGKYALFPVFANLKC